MPNNLPAIGTAKYSTHTFSSYMRTEGIKGKAMWDKAGRTITHMVWTITIKDRISSATTIKTTMEGLRQTLMAPAKPFVYTSKGFGDLSVNVGAVKDVAFGPKPLAFNWEPVGNDYVADITWTVEVAIPECDNANYRGIMEAWFKVDYKRDQYGLTERTFDGFIKIAMQRNGRRLIDTADAYYSKFIPSVPNKFRRMDKSESLSENKAELTIHVVDKELPSDNVPPEGIIEAEFEHNISCNNGSIKKLDDFFTRHSVRCAGTYTVARGYKASIAVQNFAAAVKDRILDLRKDLKKDGQGQAGDLWQVLPMGSSITEVDAYGLTKVKCTFNGVLIGPPSIWMIRGLFRQMPGSNYDLWAKSMADTWSSRGWAQLKFDTNDDAIIDLCLGGEPHVLKGKPPQRPPVRGAINNQQKGWGWPWPDKDKSHIDIQTSLTLEPEDHVLRHVPLESGEARLVTPALLGRDAFATLAALAKGSNKPIYQARAATMPSVIFAGHIIRAGWEITPPVLRGAFGRAAIPANGPGFGFVQESYPYSGPVPIHIAAWRLRYYLSDDPVQIDGGIKANPVPLPPPQQPPLGGNFNFNGGGFGIINNQQANNQGLQGLFGNNGGNFQFV